MSSLVDDPLPVGQPIIKIYSSKSHGSEFAVGNKAAGIPSRAGADPRGSLRPFARSTVRWTWGRQQELLLMPVAIDSSVAMWAT